MAQIVTITNPLTGQPAQVDQLEHTAQQIDDSIGRALPGGEIDTLLAGKANASSVYTKTESDTLLAEKEPVFTTLPISKGGTGANNVKNARANLGIDKLVTCPAGSSISLTLPFSSIYLIGTSDNVRQRGLILVYTNDAKAQNNVQTVTTLDTPSGWSYSLSGGLLTLSETGGRYSADFSIVTLCTGRYQPGVYS